MPWKRILKWIALVFGGLLFVILLTGAIAWRHRVYYDSHGRSAEYRRIDKLAEHDPLAALRLLASDSLLTRRQARWAVQSQAKHFDDAILDKIRHELTEQTSFDKRGLVEALNFAGDRGVRQIIRLYREAEWIDPEVHHAVCKLAYAWSGETELTKELRILMNDSTLPELHRRRAVEALSYNWDDPYIHNAPFRAEEAEPEFERWIATLPVALAQSARIARAAGHAEDMAERKNYFTPEIVSPAKDGGAAALAALEDSNDWLRVAMAAELLARYQKTDAAPVLERVAKEHWNHLVRKTAAHAVRTLQGSEPPLPSVELSIGELIVARYEAEESEATRRYFKEHPPNVPRPSEAELKREAFVRKYVEPIHDLGIWTLRPRIDQVLFLPPEGLPYEMSIDDLGDYPMLPRVTARFAGGKLLGYNEGEFGGGVVFYRRGQMPLAFPTANVIGFVPRPFGMLVIQRNHVAHHGFVSLVYEDTNGRIAMKNFQRLRFDSWEYRVLPNGDLEVGGITIAPDGQVRRIEPTEIEH